MFIKKHREKIIIPKKIFNNYDMKKIAFFDIETTGFDKVRNSIILISIGFFMSRNIFCVKQYFAQSIEEENELLQAIKKDLKNFRVWCSYNGKAFDEPFIKRKMEMSNVEFNPPKKHIDLYRIIRPYHKQLGMEGCSLKNVEKHLEIDRDDTIDGGESVDLYFQFLNSRDLHIRDKIMLHNFEDVLNLPKIFKVIYDIEYNSELKREDCITDNQLRYLKHLLKKNGISISEDIERISKKSASKIINSILQGNIDVEEFKNIINNSY